MNQPASLRSDHDARSQRSRCSDLSVHVGRNPQLALAAALLLAAVPAKPVEDPPGWKRIDIAEAGFSVAFPGVPTRAEVPIQLSGHPARVRSFILDRDGARWALLVNEPGTTISREEIERMPEGMAAFLEHVVRQLPAERQGHRGFEVEQRSGNASVLWLLVAGNDRMYQVMVSVEKGALPAQAHAFLDGFRMIPVVAPPPVPVSKRAEQWEEYAPKGARFAARFPSKPTEQPGQTPDGVPTRVFVAEQDGVRFSVLRVPLTGSGADDRPLGAEACRLLVDKVVDEARTKMARMAASVTVSEPAVVSRFPARDLKASQGTMTMFLRVVVTPDALFQIGVMATGGPAGAGQARFVDSFRVVRQ